MLKEQTGDYAAAMALLAVGSLLAALAVVILAPVLEPRAAAAKAGVA